jgi:ribonucleotide monophosphatase NagD (HAD superfamily)
MMDTRPKTIICDIDGTLIEHNKPDVIASGKEKSVLLEGTIDKINEWERKGYNIILLTGRKESMRKITVNSLAKLGIYYDHLIMGVGGGQRYLINDRKPSGDDYAFAINIDRNSGIKTIEI